MSGIKIGRYEVTSELGRGGMGIVYKAVDPMLERELAIKILPPKKLSKDLIERFLREARAVAKLDSPYIVKIFDIGEQPDGDNRIYYIVMEFVRGKTLGEHFSEGPPGNFDELWDRLEIFDQVLEAIDYAHEQGVIHRDLKPDNLMVTPNERVKIMDFGLAFFAGSHSLTRADQIMGTVAYFSPEQAKAAKDIDHRADIYSLGVILFELLTGELPFQAEHPLDMMQKLLTEPPRRPRSLNPIVTAELEEICLKCLEKQPAVRYHKVADLRRDLQAVKAPPQAPRGGGSQSLPQHRPFTTTSSPAPQPGGPQSSPLPSGATRRPGGSGATKPSFVAQTPFTPPAFSPPVVPPVVPPEARPAEAGDPVGYALGAGVPPVGSAPPPAGVPSIGAPPAVPPVSAMLVTAFDGAPEEADPPCPATPPVVQSLHPSLASTSWQMSMQAEHREEEPVEPVKPKAGSSFSSIGPSIFCQCGGENPPGSDICLECGEEIRPSIYIVRREADSHYTSGMNALARGHLNEARAEFLQAIEQNREFGEAYLELGRTELSLGMFDEAHEHLEQALSYMGSRIQPLLALADLYQQVEQSEDVAACLRDVLADRPRDTEIRCRLALLYCQLNETAKALSTYRAALKYDPNSLAANRQLGLLLASNDQNDEAILYLETACRLDPHDGYIRGILGKLYASTGRLRQAEETFGEALQLRQDDPDLRVELGDLYRQQGRVDQAVSQLQKTLRREEGHLGASKRLAQVHLDQGQYDEALGLLKKAVRFHPEDDALHRQMGEVYLMKGQLDGALEAFEKVVELRPECAEMRSRLGRVYLKKKYDDKSVEEYQKAISMDPLAPAYREDLGMAYYVSGQLEKAASELHKAAKLDGKNADYFKALGFIYHELNMPGPAIEHFRWALHLDPGDARTRGALGQALIAHGLANQAIDQFREALRIDPSLSLLHLSLARALASAGHHKEAARSFRAFAASIGQNESSQLLSRAFLDMGHTLLLAGDLGQAAEVYQAALSRPDEEARARAGLAQVALARSDLKGATTHLKRALELEPLNAEVWHVWSFVAAEKEDWDEAIRRMERALSLDADKEEYWVQLGRLFRKAGRSREADETFRKGAEKFPHSRARFYWLRGRLAARQKDWTRAYDHFRVSLELAPGSWRVYEDMALACLGLQNWRQAEEHIHKAAELAPADKRDSVLTLLGRLPA
jgi:tetratricopeptide (TPR) repeat protein/serine/threonine protein kinase